MHASTNVSHTKVVGGTFEVKGKRHSLIRGENGDGKCSKAINNLKVTILVFDNWCIKLKRFGPLENST